MSVLAGFARGMARGLAERSRQQMQFRQQVDLIGLQFAKEQKKEREKEETRKKKNADAAKLIGNSFKLDKPAVNLLAARLNTGVLSLENLEKEAAQLQKQQLSQAAQLQKQQKEKAAAEKEIGRQASFMSSKNVPMNVVKDLTRTGTFQQDLNTQKELYSSPYNSFNNVDSKLFTGYAGNTLDNFEYMLNRSKSSKEDLIKEVDSIGSQFYNSRFVRQDPLKIIKYANSNRDKLHNDLQTVSTVENVTIDDLMELSAKMSSMNYFPTREERLLASKLTGLPALSGSPNDPQVMSKRQKILDERRFKLDTIPRKKAEQFSSKQKQRLDRLSSTGGSTDALGTDDTLVYADADFLKDGPKSFSDDRTDIEKEISSASNRVRQREKDVIDLDAENQTDLMLMSEDINRGDTKFDPDEYSDLKNETIKRIDERLAENLLENENIRKSFFSQELSSSYEQYQKEEGYGVETSRAKALLTSLAGKSFGDSWNGTQMGFNALLDRLPSDEAKKIRSVFREARENGTLASAADIEKESFPVKNPVQQKVLARKDINKLVEESTKETIARKKSRISQNSISPTPKNLDRSNSLLSEVFQEEQFLPYKDAGILKFSFPETANYLDKLDPVALAKETPDVLKNIVSGLEEKLVLQQESNALSDDIASTKAQIRVAKNMLSKTGTDIVAITERLAANPDYAATLDVDALNSNRLRLAIRLENPNLTEEEKTVTEAALKNVKNVITTKEGFSEEDPNAIELVEKVDALVENGVPLSQAVEFVQKSFSNNPDITKLIDIIYNDPTQATILFNELISGEDNISVLRHNIGDKTIFSKFTPAQQNSLKAKLKDYEDSSENKVKYDQKFLESEVIKNLYRKNELQENLVNLKNLPVANVESRFDRNRVNAQITLGANELDKANQAAANSISVLQNFLGSKNIKNVNSLEGMAVEKLRIIQDPTSTPEVRAKAETNLEQILTTKRKVEPDLGPKEVYVMDSNGKMGTISQEKYDRQKIGDAETYAKIPTELGVKNIGTNLGRDLNTQREINTQQKSIQGLIPVAGDLIQIVDKNPLVLSTTAGATVTLEGLAKEWQAVKSLAKKSGEGTELITLTDIEAYNATRLSDASSQLAKDTALFNSQLMLFVFRAGAAEGQSGNAMSNRDFQKLTEIFRPSSNNQVFIENIQKYTTGKVKTLNESIENANNTLIDLKVTGRIRFESNLGPEHAEKIATNYINSSKIQPYELSEEDRSNLLISTSDSEKGKNATSANLNFILNKQLDRVKFPTDRQSREDVLSKLMPVFESHRANLEKYNKNRKYKEGSATSQERAEKFFAKDLVRKISALSAVAGSVLDNSQTMEENSRIAKILYNAYIREISKGE